MVTLRGVLVFMMELVVEVVEEVDVKREEEGRVVVVFGTGSDATVHTSTICPLGQKMHFLRHLST